MIPKKIHYCWFGSKKKSKTFYKCLESWKKLCPEYEIIEWNEKNSLQYSNHFYKNALRKKKYAFVSDYVRVKVLNEFGGIYFDTDMFLVKKIDKLLKYRFFSGFEDDESLRVNYAFFGGVEKHRFFLKMLNFYDTKEFDEFNPPIITHTFKKIICSETVLEEEKLFTKEYFYPLPFKEKDNPIKNFITNKTIAIHLWDHSWKTEKKENVFSIFNDIKVVLIDFLFYGYSWKYFSFYILAFCKKIYHLKSKYK